MGAGFNSVTVGDMADLTNFVIGNGRDRQAVVALIMAENAVGIGLHEMVVKLIELVGVTAQTVGGRRAVITDAAGT